MEIMGGVHLYLLLLLVTLIQGIQGQAITPSSVFVAVGDDVSLECTTTTETPGFSFSWTNGAGVVIYSGGTKQPPPEQYVNFDLTEDTTAKRSTLIINDILRQDAGGYRCGVTGQDIGDPTPVTVEVGSPPQMINLTVSGDDSSSMYQATYEAIGSSPEETITWILGGVTQPADSDSIVETDPGTSNDSLFDIKSVFTFPSTPENFNVTLECIIRGHQVAKLNRQETRLVNIHKPPQPGVILIDLTLNGTNLTISCDDINSEAVPAMSTLNIYSGKTLITKPESDKAVTVTEPEQRTEFRCEGSNYLGSTTTSQFYGSTPAPPPTTEPIYTTEGTTASLSALETTPSKGDESNDGKQTGPDDPPIGLIIGCVVAVIVIIGVIIVVVCIGKNKGWFTSSGTKSSGSSKPAGSAVGSSNGSEREKTRPEAAPRGHGSIQHTNDNPNQDMYAMVDKKKPAGGGGGGDVPDRGSGPGQNEPGSMLYADLDLSHKAGHTDKHVPKNENDVVVYSSILV